MGQAVVEWKLDGARVQVHKDGEDVRVYTRNLNDITPAFGQCGVGGWPVSLPTR